LPLGRKTNKSQAVRYIELATWKKDESKSQVVRYVGPVAWKEDKKINLKLSVMQDLPLGRKKKKTSSCPLRRTCHLEERQINLKLSVM